MAVRTTAVTSTAFSECFERKLKEVANQDNDTFISRTGWGTQAAPLGSAVVVHYDVTSLLPASAPV